MLLIVNEWCSVKRESRQHLLSMTFVNQGKGSSLGLVASPRRWSESHASLCLSESVVSTARKLVPQLRLTSGPLLDFG